MILAADAAPLIFLAKINQLFLLSKLFDAEILVPAAVKNEVLGSEVPPDEERLLIRFLSNCRIIQMRKPEKFASALSHADNCILTLAIQKRADLVLSDDRLLRKTAVIEGFRVVGTIGILIQASKIELVAQEKSAALLDELVKEHNFRISTRVYKVAQEAIYNI